MHTETGEIRPLNADSFKEMPPAERALWVEVKRDLTPLENFQRQIAKYSPCGCGSGKKFKFCCYARK